VFILKSDEDNKVLACGINMFKKLKTSKKLVCVGKVKYSKKLAKLSVQVYTDEYLLDFTDKDIDSFCV